MTSILIILSSGCSVLQKSSKQELSDGFYLKKTAIGNSKVYVDVVDDIIRIHPTLKQDKQLKADTLNACELYKTEVKVQETVGFSLRRNSFDVDFLTIPLKLRLAQNNVPAQLNANLNGALYFGYRTDIYKIDYQSNPINTIRRNTNHFGYSIGIFSGFGNTFMSPTNTNNILQQEYDGIVWSKGIAGIVGINSFTTGLAIGFDNLLDKNKSIWIYHNKPWFGLVFGLNLN